MLPAFLTLRLVRSERLGWLEVSHLMFPSIAYNYDIEQLWAKLAQDTVDSQLDTGLVMWREHTAAIGLVR